MMRPLLAALALALAGCAVAWASWQFKLRTADHDEVEVHEVGSKVLLFVASSGVEITKGEARKIGWALLEAGDGNCEARIRAEVPARVVDAERMLDSEKIIDGRIEP